MPVVLALESEANLHNQHVRPQFYKAPIWKMEFWMIPPTF